MTNSIGKGRFHLVRYFSAASLAMFALVAMAMMFFEQRQNEFFQDVQARQIQFFSEVQKSFADQQNEVARRDLLAIHEAGNVNLTRLFANALWDSDFAPLVVLASEIPVDPCRAIPDQEVNGKRQAPPDKTACFAEVGKRIMALPGFEAINAKVFDSMKKSTVFKIKVFDLRGVTVYSSEQRQIGEDKSNNQGWQQAMTGVPASELTHRDSFSAFEGVVENRDVISSYLPVYRPGTTDIVGAFEVYSDVTQFLAKIQHTSAAISAIAARNQAQVVSEADASQARIDQNSNLMLAILAVLLLVLFAGLFLIVRRADQILAQQEQEREEVLHQLAQAEKMASLGQMVAGVAHQLNSPLAFSHNNVSLVLDALKDLQPAGRLVQKMGELLKGVDGDQARLKIDGAKDKIIEIAANLPEPDMLRDMLTDTLGGIDQMRELVENLRDFTRLDRSKTGEFDINKGLRNVVYIAKSVIPPRIQVIEAYQPVPPLICNLSQLNQVFLNLINNAAQAISAEGTIQVRSQLDGDRLLVQVSDTGAGIPPEVLPKIFDMYFTTKPEGEGTGMGLAIARTILVEHGGDLTVESTPGMGTTFTASLPLGGPEA